MPYLSYPFLFLFGLCVGSFLNVASLRYGSGRSIVTDRSKCPHCGKKLSWFELIPLLSFVLQAGRCRTCRTRISFQYPLIELLTGAVFLLIFWKTDFFNLLLTGNFFSSLAETIFLLVIFSILIVIAIYDYWHKIIPDELVYSFIIISFFGFFIIPNSEFVIHLISGPVISLPFFLIWLVSGGKWMGFGDVKLGLGMGFFLGIFKGLYAVLWSFWVGGIFSIFLMLITPLFLKSKSFTMKSEVPFGPFMILGIAIAFFLDWNFLNFILFLNF